MKLANIIYEKDLVNHTQVDYVNYFKEHLEYNKVDKSLPTLYVGWSFMKKCNPDDNIVQNANILDKQIIANELFWECSFDESKSSHVNGVEAFIASAPQYYFSPKYNYINLDPVFFQIKDIEDLMDILPKSLDKFFNLKNEMIYLLKNNQIWGINFKMFEFFQFNIDEMINKISERTAVQINDISGDIYQNYYKILPDFVNLKRYLVTL